MTEFRAKTNKLFTLIPLVIGGFLMFCALDFFLLHRFFKFSDGTTSGALVFAGLLGLLFFLMGAKGIFAPSTVLLANTRGITIYPSRHTISNKGRKKSLTIPWSSILTISKGKMISGHATRHSGPKTRIGGGFVAQKTSTKARYAPAVKILIAPSVNLGDCSAHGALQTRTGTPPEEITNEDKSHFSEEELDEYMKTECLVSKAVLPKSVAQSIQVLTSLMNQNK